MAGFTALGVWQIERRAWKLDLISQVDSRIHQPPIAAPANSDKAYLHVAAHGVYLNDKETLVQASTELGAGYWVLTPLKTDDAIILVNRGFIPADAPHNKVTGATDVTGLLRLTEPHGRWPRTNDPAHDHWYSRDVAAIAAARGLDHAAPYFIDADSGSDPTAFPRGGLTVTNFPNNHLIYALTWFALAGLSAFGGYRAVREHLS